MLRREDRALLLLLLLVQELLVLHLPLVEHRLAGGLRRLGVDGLRLRLGLGLGLGVLLGLLVLEE